MKNYYAVKKGRVPGVYTTWEECQQQVKNHHLALMSLTIFLCFITFNTSKTYYVITRRC
ncbi:viroplasmin family protein [Pelosinus fermentans]|uniref:ribonuclease H1 domain-containing protein n=1 Tax=Pelosinus fermentans TaxID=365349 RepID=UPI003AF32692